MSSPVSVAPVSDQSADTRRADADADSRQAQRRRPGRPRDLSVRQAILTAARAILEESGPMAVTMEGVAARAGVGKPTLYRWWPDRHAVAMAALMDSQLPDVAAAVMENGAGKRGRERSTRQAPLRALQQQLIGAAQTLASRTGRNVAMMIAASDPQSELSKAFRNHFILTRREEGRAWLAQAQALGQLDTKLDLEVALDQIYGALFFRLLLGHAPIDEQFVKRLLAQVLAGLARGKPAAVKLTAPKPAARNRLASAKP